MEAVGVALAVLPLLLNQLDNYVQGLETIKGFRAKRYLRELEGYFTSLDAQQTIFVNHLLRSLDGVEYEDEIDDPSHAGLGALWRRQSLQSSLKTRLGRNYNAFAQIVHEISSLLDDLSRKLGWDNNMSVEKYWGNTSSIEKEVKKFRDIFSKSIYSDLFNRLNHANKTLGTLLKQADYQNTMSRQKISKAPLLRQRKARRSARSLHNTIIRGTCWKCACKDLHLVHFVFSPLEEENLTQKDPKSSSPRFRLLFSANSNPGFQNSAYYGHEIEAQPDLIHSTNEAQIGGTCQDLPLHDESGPGRKKRKVLFSLPEPKHQTTSLPTVAQASPISDICHTLSMTSASGGHSQLLGCLSDENYQHNMYYVRSYSEILKSQSLAELILASNNPRATPRDRFIFPQRHRLKLAVNLACSVLQFHGSWLKTHWRARDIMFTAKTSADVENPYVRWNMMDGDENMKQKASTALIRSEILFPLGLVLVELSLCQTLDSLCTPDDEDHVQAHKDLKTAARHIPLVELESGEEFGKVVERCLFWPGIKECTLDDERMQDEVFQLIVLPLIKNLHNFEGRSSIR